MCIYIHTYIIHIWTIYNTEITHPTMAQNHPKSLISAWNHCHLPWRIRQLLIRHLERLGDPPETTIFHPYSILSNQRLSKMVVEDEVFHPLHSMKQYQDVSRMIFQSKVAIRWLSLVLPITQDWDTASSHPPTRSYHTSASASAHSQVSLSACAWICSGWKLA